MIARNGLVLTFTAKEEDAEILDFIESRMQLFEIDNIIQTFINQRRTQREYDLRVELRALINDPISKAQIEEVIREFKERNP